MVELLLLLLVVLAFVLGADVLYQNDDALSRLLDAVTGKGGGNIGGGTLRLFTAPTTVSKTRVFGDFTQATFTGYAGVVLATATWATAAVTANVAAATYGANVVFTKGVGAAQTIYGWYLTDAGNTKLYACALFASGPYTVTNPGDAITVVPTLNYQSTN